MTPSPTAQPLPCRLASSLGRGSDREELGPQHLGPQGAPTSAVGPGSPGTPGRSWRGCRSTWGPLPTWPCGPALGDLGEGLLICRTFSEEC